MQARIKEAAHSDSGLIAQLSQAKVKDDGQRKKNYSKKNLEQLNRYYCGTTWMPKKKC